MGQKTILDFWSKRKEKDVDSLPSNSPVWMELERILIPRSVEEGGEVSNSKPWILFVRLENGPVKLFKRILRLMHITSIFSVEHYTSYNRPVFNPAVLTEFGKMKYAGTPCCFPLKPSHVVSLQTTSARQLAVYSEQDKSSFRHDATWMAAIKRAGADMFLSVGGSGRATNDGGEFDHESR